MQDINAADVKNTVLRSAILNLESRWNRVSDAGAPGACPFCYVGGRGRAAAEINLLSNVLPGSGAVVKARQNNRGKKATASRAGRASRKGATRDDVLNRMRAVVLGSAVEMMEAVCEEGKRGSYLHAKFALEAGLLYPPPVQVADPKVAEAAEAE